MTILCKYDTLDIYKHSLYISILRVWILWYDHYCKNFFGGKQTMNMNVMEEIIRTMLKARNEGTSRQQREVYLQMASEINKILQSVQYQQSCFKKIAGMVADNPILSEQFLMLSKGLERELEAIDKIREMSQSIANQ